MKPNPDIENMAGIARITCGWKKPELPIELVRRYWRDVHSPAIARRAGIWDYRHFQFGAVKNDLFAPIERIDFSCPADAQLMWLSDVRYRDEAALALFGTSPDGLVKAQLLGDIDLIVDQSTTYKSILPNARTFIDDTGAALPQGVPVTPIYGLFFRKRGEELPFRAALTDIAEKLARDPAVLRVRLSLLDAPDMAAERAGGYPIKTHPIERQYQAWIDLAVIDGADISSLLTRQSGIDYAATIAAIHAYPVIALYTFNYGGRPTLAGLRGYHAWDAITSLGGRHSEPEILQWMYGPLGADIELGQAAE